MRRLIFAAIATAALVAGSTRTTEAQAGVSCSVSATGVAFGAYDVLASSPADSSGTISILCNRNRSVTVTMSAGSSGSYSSRTLRKGADALNYNLFLDAARTQIWGNNSGGSGQLDLTVARNATSTVPVYGRIPARQNAAIGSYNDSIIVTVIY
jgi:spore coat protein U-like protein